MALLPGLLPDHEIKRLAEAGMISDFVDAKTVDYNMPSYGLSSFGYDIRLADEWMFPANETDVIDPCLPNGGIMWTTRKCPSIIVPGNRAILARSLETVDMPDDVLGVMLGKSTVARCFSILLTTPIEPGWRGQITLEISNTVPNPIRLSAGMGIGQLLFFRGARPSVGYGTSGRYQDQVGVQPSKVCRAAMDLQRPARGGGRPGAGLDDEIPFSPCWQV